MVFVNSMSDLFHKKIPMDFVNRVFDVMEESDRHIFQILTKRSSSMRNYINFRYGPKGKSPRHIWIGVSIESPKLLVRLKHLKETRADVRFVSFEPLLEKIGRISFAEIDWAIVGGESGPGARPMKRQWVRELRDQCNR